MNSSAYPPIDWARVDLLIDLALQEDLDTTGDVTTNSVVPEEAVARAVLLCKEPGHGDRRARRGRTGVQKVEPRLEFTALKHDGDSCGVGEVFAEIKGPAAAS